MTLLVAGRVLFAGTLLVGCGTTDAGASREGASSGAGGRDGGSAPRDAARDGGHAFHDAAGDTTSHGDSAALRDGGPTWPGCAADGGGSRDAAAPVWMGCEYTEAKPCPLECSADGSYPAPEFHSLDTFPWQCPLPAPFGTLGWARRLGHFVEVSDGSGPPAPTRYGYDLCSGELVGMLDGSCPVNPMGGVLREFEPPVGPYPEPQSEPCLPCEGCDLSAAVARWRAGYVDLP